MHTFTLFFLVLLAGCQPSTPAQQDQENETPPSQNSSSEEGVANQNVLKSDPAESSISFIGKSSIVDHPGTFESFDVILTRYETDPLNLEKATVTATINIASVKTDSKGLDGHLQKEDFFAADRHPNAVFASTSITKNNGGSYDITGDLTMKGITKKITIKATTFTDASLVGMFDISRKEFGIGNDSYGDKLLDLLVPVTIMVKFQSTSGGQVARMLFFCA